jgi:hypothetical protein
MDWYLILVPYLYLVYWMKDSTSMDWYFYEVHHIKRRWVGWDFFLFLITPPFLNRQFLWNRFSSPPMSDLWSGTELTPLLNFLQVRRYLYDSYG